MIGPYPIMGLQVTYACPLADDYSYQYCAEIVKESRMTYMRVRSRTKKTDLGKKNCLYMICSGVKSYSRDEITGIYHCGYFNNKQHLQKKKKLRSSS